MPGYTSWCWVDERWECMDSADGSILHAAMTRYNNTSYEYGDLGFGIDWDRNGKKELNCRQLVAYTLETLGYHAPDMFKWKWQPSSVYYKEYFCPVEYDKAQPGDIIHFDPEPGFPYEHVGTIESIIKDGRGGWDCIIVR